MLVTDPIIDSNVPRTISTGDLQPGAEVFYEDLLIVFVIVAEVRRYDKSAPHVFSISNLPSLLCHSHLLCMSKSCFYRFRCTSTLSVWLRLQDGSHSRIWNMLVTFMDKETVRHVHYLSTLECAIRTSSYISLVASIRSIIPGLSPSLHPGKYTSHLHGLHDRKTLDLEVVEKDFEVVKRVKCTRKLQ